MKRTGPKPTTRIVHFGPGAFFRAFVAPYTADAGGDWGIAAVSLRSAGLRDCLAGQDQLYTAAALGPNGIDPQLIEVLTSVLVASEDPAAVIETMVDPAVEIVTMTITEKGYCHNPATGDLQSDHPDIIHDLEFPDAPKSALGFLVAGLAMRRVRGVAPFTVLSCDNLPDNGALTRHVVLEFAEALDPELADWIARSVKFPATMVDRITPATTEADIERLQAETGYSDPACVMHEPFRQWVIEDDFTGDRPDWQAQFVKDVAAFEKMKLRCLNGTHSALAYLGYLAGYETISETVSDPVFVQFVQQLWACEIIPSVPQPEGEDLTAYCRSLLARYQNPAIQHRTWQIAMDGSQKLPQRLLGTMADNLTAGRPIDGLALSVAAWMRYVGGVDEAGNPIDVRDPLADQLRRSSDPQALLSLHEVFDPALANIPEFRAAIEGAYQTLVSKGSKAAVVELLA